EPFAKDLDRLLRAEMATHIVPDAVRAQALNRKLTQVRLSHVYAVAPGWETEELSRAEGIMDIATSDALEQTLHKDDKGLLVRRSACPSLDNLKSLLETATAQLTV